jgi:hypothetical protein
MTHIAIKKQISEQMEALDRTTRNDIKSKESANQYLRELGLINNKEDKRREIKKGK